MRSVRCRTGAAGMIAFAAAAALALASPLSLSGQATLLRMKPPEGQVTRYTFSMEATMENPMMPSTDPVFTVRGHQTQMIVSVVDGVIRVRATLDSMAVTSAIGADQMPDLSGSVFTMEMDERGKVLRVIDTEGLPDDGALMLGEMFENPDYFLLPEDAVAPGDTWVSAGTVNLPLGDAAMDTSSEFSLEFESLEGNLATIAFEGPMQVRMDMGGMGVDATGTMSGSFVIDLEAGRYHGQEMRLNVDMNVGGMAMSMETVTTLTLVPGS